MTELPKRQVAKRISIVGSEFISGAIRMRNIVIPAPSGIVMFRPYTNEALVRTGRSNGRPRDKLTCR